MQVSNREIQHVTNRIWKSKSKTQKELFTVVKLALAGVNVEVAQKREEARFTEEYTKDEFLRDLRRQVKAGNASASKFLAELMKWVDETEGIAFENVDFSRACEGCPALELIEESQRAELKRGIGSE